MNEIRKRIGFQKLAGRWYKVEIEETKHPLNEGHDAQTIVGKIELDSEPSKQMRISASLTNKLGEII